MSNIILPQVKAENNTKTDTIVDRYYKSNCRITQDEDEHIIKGNGSMYAYDIACGGQTEVYVPSFFDRYYIKKVGHDIRLGDYIILRNGDYEIVISHISLSGEIKEGIRINKKTYLGQTNLSGISTGHHIHTELWLRGKNIKFEKLMGGDLVVNEEYSFVIKKQRGWLSSMEINQAILDFISGFEGFRTEAYPDGFNPDGSIRYSIGKGTKSFKGETITLEEAKKRSRKVIQNIRETYSLLYLDLDKQKALVSFIYNVGSLSQKQIWLLENKYYKALANDMLQYNKITIIKDGKKEKVIAGGLVNRRKAEYNLLLNVN